MRFLGKAIFAGAVILGPAACTAVSFSSDGVGDLAFFGDASTSGAPFLCTEDAGVLTPIGPQGCRSNETVVYRKQTGVGASAIGNATNTTTTPQPAMVAACTQTKCAPGQVAVVTYQAAPSDPVSTDAGGSDGAVTVVALDAGSIADSGVALAPDDAASDGGAMTPSLSDAEAADASDDATASAADAGVIGIPCGAVVTCVDSPPTCPNGQSPSYAPNGKWHCLPLCDPSNPNTVVITYGGTYGNTSICAGAPPTMACPTQGQVWTWDFAVEEWVCAAECNNGQYDQHTYGGQTVCVPC
jgi:hypothetical protein